MEKIQIIKAVLQCQHLFACLLANYVTLKSNQEMVYLTGPTYLKAAAEAWLKILYVKLLHYIF